MDEPNGADTFHALESLKLLGALEPDTETASFLKLGQEADGSFDSVEAAYFIIGGLSALGEKVDKDPARYLQSKMRMDKVENLPVWQTSAFERLFRLADACITMNVPFSDEVKEKMACEILRMENPDGGFGHKCSTLVETAHALYVLNWLISGVDALPARSFVDMCQDQNSGYVNIPGLSTSFLEHVYAGVTASHLLNDPPRYRQKCINFIEFCQRANGGFTRATMDGIPTLGYTYLAIHGLSLLDAL